MSGETRRKLKAKERELERREVRLSRPGTTGLINGKKSDEEANNNNNNKGRRNLKEEIERDGTGE